MYALKDHMDMKDKMCDRCEKGRYRLGSLGDDSGNVYCEKCHHATFRYRPITKGRKKNVR